MDSIYQILDNISKTDKKSALATIFNVEGAAYLKEGTSMLILEDETKIGMISAGCLEEDICKRALQVMHDEVPRTIIYNMADDDEISCGVGTGCNGIVYVLIEPMTKLLKQQFLLLMDCLSRHIPVEHYKTFTKSYSFEKNYFIPIKGNSVEELPSSIKYITTRKSGLQKPNLIELVYYHRFVPRPRLVIFGAGQDAVPLVSMAEQVGFSTVLCDWREGLCNKNNFPTADKLIVGFPDAMFKELALSEMDYVILMTHQFQKDKEILNYLIGQKLRYLGILGSAERTKRLLNKKSMTAEIHFPIGLPIGAKGPQEIAISILAELISVLRKEQSDGVYK